MSNFGFFIIPIILFIIILTGFFKKIPVFDVFLQGAGEGINSTFSIAPSLIGLVTSVTMLKASGALDLFSNFLTPICNLIHVPPQIVPLAILRPISGSGSIALLDNIFKNFGPDSITGKIASVIMGSTETTFYTITVYFGSIGIKNLRHTVTSAVIADITAIITAILLVNLCTNVF